MESEAAATMRWKSERKGVRRASTSSSSKKKAPVPKAKRSLTSAKEKASREIRRARSFENLESIKKSLENLEMRERESFESPEWIDEDVKAYYERSWKRKDASAPSVGEVEVLPQEVMGLRSRDVEAEITEAKDEEAMRMIMIEEEEEEEKKAKAEAETMESDPEAHAARLFRDDWPYVWSSTHGSYEDTTKIGPMRFTDEPATNLVLFPMSTLQIFSVKVEGIRRSLQWPLDVFGMVAVRDNIDFNRNVIFSRTRDNCQTLTKEDRTLALEGPTRAVVWQDYLYIEAKLIVKGATESEDEDLSFLVVPFVCGPATYSYLTNRYITSKLSTLRFMAGHIVRSVEATIFVRVIDGSLPDDFRAQFVSFTTGIRRKRVATIDHKKIILLNSGSGKVPVTSEGRIMLSRYVVSAETTGKLRVCVKAWEASKGVKNAVRDELVFTPKKANRSSGLLDTGFCKMEVTVAWSLVSYL